MELDLVGPHVTVDRNGTADRGGGQLVIKQGKLLVRTRSMERLLGSAIAIDNIQIVDLARLRARVSFIDGQVWNVQSEEGEDLAPFFRQVESVSGRIGLLRDPPRISEHVRAAATPARVRAALLTVLALLTYVPLRWLGAVAPPAGLVIAVLGVAALLLGAATLLPRDEDDPGLLARLRPWVSSPALGGALAAIVAGSIGDSDASARLARERDEARAAEQAKQHAEAAAADEQKQVRERRAQVDAIAQQLLTAMHDERFREAKALHERIETLAPDHPTAKQVWPQLQRALADLDERERVAGVARGIAQARAVTSDPLACETAKRVADVHALLRPALPSDQNYDAARRALDKLERCRKRVRAHFAQSAEEARRRLRMMAATQIESQVRRLGYPVSVTLSGRKSDVLRIAGRELNAAAAQRILALREAKDASFEAARTDDGFARIELHGDKFTQDVALHPLPAEALVVPVLEKFALASPLTLQDADQ